MRAMGCYSRSMKRIVVAISIVLLLHFAGCKSRPDAGSESPPGGNSTSRVSPSVAGSGFDFYLLNLSWSPEFCYGHRDAAECAARSTFVLHGLWPENTDGSYPESCSNAPGPADPAQYASLYPDPNLLQ